MPVREGKGLNYANRKGNKMWYTTKDGRHINTDWFDQERQIAQNKADADERNNEPTDLSKMKYEETKDWFRKNSNYTEWEEELDDVDYTKDEEEWWKFDVTETIHNYTGERFMYMNETLREGKTKMPDWYNDKAMAEDMRQLDYAISKFELNKPITVYRASSSDMLGKDKMSYEEMKAMVGKTIKDKAYTSTSTVKEIPGEQTVGGSVEYVIDVPKGKGVGAYIARFSENSQEREFLIKRNSSYKVTRVEDNNGSITVYMKMEK